MSIVASKGESVQNSRVASEVYMDNGCRDTSDPVQRPKGYGRDYTEYGVEVVHEGAKGVSVYVGRYYENRTGRRIVRNGVDMCVKDKEIVVK